MANTSVRSRLISWMLALVVIVLLLSGLGVAILENRNVINNQEHQLANQSQTIAQDLSSIQRANVFAAIARLSGIAGISIVPFDASGRLLTGMKVGSFTTALPANVTPSFFPASQILSGQTVSGRVGHTLYSGSSSTDKVIFQSCPAGYRYLLRLSTCIDIKSSKLSRATIRPPTTNCPSCQGVLVVLTTNFASTTPIVRYLFFTALIAFAIALVLAIEISQRFSRPLLEVAKTTDQIARGDLNSRVPLQKMTFIELSSLANSINTMAERLAHSKDSERNFLLSISHDLRTPLTSIRGYSDAIIDGVMDNPTNAAMIISSESKRLERLVADLLDLAKLDAQSFSFEFTSSDLLELIKGTLQSFYPIFRDAHLTLNFENHAPDQISIYVDPDRLAQILGNLIENAYKYAISQVDIRLSQGDSQSYLLTIEDDGPGIPPDDLPHIFERLYRSGAAPARNIGSGLGLAIVAQLSHAMDINIAVASPITANKGARFTLSFSKQ